MWIFCSKIAVGAVLTIGMITPAAGDYYMGVWGVPCNDYEAGMVGYVHWWADGLAWPSMAYHQTDVYIAWNCGVSAVYADAQSSGQSTFIDANGYFQRADLLREGWTDTMCMPSYGCVTWNKGDTGVGTC
jgi:hypothetical protein